MEQCHPERILCDECYHAFSNVGNLKRHKRNVHDETRAKHQCDFCPKAFTQQSLLHIHLRSHTGEKPFMCNICGKAYSSSSSLNRHYETHGTRQACQLCYKTFSTKSALRIHVKKYHSTVGKTYRCRKCNKAFHDKHAAKAHQSKCKQ